MEERSGIRGLIQRIWQATGGQIKIKDEPQLPVEDDEYLEDWDDPLEPMPLWIKIFYGIIAVAVAIGIAAWFLKGYSDKYLYIQTVILALTLIVVAVYTILTRNMQKAMVQQINVSILPIFEVKVIVKGEREPRSTIGGNAVQSRLELKNIGNGVALNIEIDPLYVRESFSALYPFGEPLWFDRVISLSPDEFATVKDVQRFDKATARLADEYRKDLLAALVSPKARRDYELAIRFTDILGNEYVQVYYLGRSGTWTGIVQPSKAVRRVSILVDGKSYGHRKRKTNPSQSALERFFS